MSHLRVILEVMIIIKNGIFTEFLQTLERFVSLESTERKSRIHIYMYTLVKTMRMYQKTEGKYIQKLSFECFRCFLINFLHFPSGQLYFVYISL